MRLILTCLLLFFTSSLTAQEPVRYGYRVLQTYPHDINAFTQGLLYEDGYLYEGTGKNGLSSLSRIDLETGEVLASTALGQRYFGEGIENVDGKMYQLTWRSQIGRAHV